MTSSTIAPVTGARMDSGFFRFDEYREFDPESVLDVLRGGRLGVIFQGVIPPDVHAVMTSRFWNSVSSVLTKLDLHDRTQAAIFGLQHGLVPLGDALEGND